MTDLKTEFGKRLKFLRERKGITQDRLAEAVNRTPSAIAKIEQGVNAPRFRLFEKIIKAVDAHPREFFDFDWDKSND